MNVCDDLIEEFTETPGEDSEAIEFMKIKRLDRIADALEGIETRGRLGKNIDGIAADDHKM